MTATSTGQGDGKHKGQMHPSPSPFAGRGVLVALSAGNWMPPWPPHPWLVSRHGQAGIDHGGDEFVLEPGNFFAGSTNLFCYNPFFLLPSPFDFDEHFLLEPLLIFAGTTSFFYGTIFLGLQQFERMIAPSLP